MKPYLNNRDTCRFKNNNILNCWVNIIIILKVHFVVSIKNIKLMCSVRRQIRRVLRKDWTNLLHFIINTGLPIWKLNFQKKQLPELSDTEKLSKTRTEDKNTRYIHINETKTNKSWFWKVVVVSSGSWETQQCDTKLHCGLKTNRFSTIWSIYRQFSQFFQCRGDING